MDGTRLSRVRMWLHAYSECADTYMRACACGSRGFVDGRSTGVARGGVTVGRGTNKESPLETGSQIKFWLDNERA